MKYKVHLVESNAAWREGVTVFVQAYSVMQAKERAIRKINKDSVGFKYTLKNVFSISQL